MEGDKLVLLKQLLVHHHEERVWLHKQHTLAVGNLGHILFVKAEITDTHDALEALRFIHFFLVWISCKYRSRVYIYKVLQLAVDFVNEGTVFFVLDWSEPLLLLDLKTVDIVGVFEPFQSSTDDLGLGFKLD